MHNTSTRNIVPARQVDDASRFVGLCIAHTMAAGRYRPVAGWGAGTHLHLRVGPAGDLDDHVEDGLLLVGIQRDVVEGRDGLAILLDVDAVLEGVGSANLAGCVLALGSHCVCSGGVEVSCQLLRSRVDFVDRSGRGGAGRHGGALAMVISHTDERDARSPMRRPGRSSREKVRAGESSTFLAQNEPRR